MITTPAIYEDVVYEVKYFPFKGRLEKIRLIFEEAGVPYLDTPVSNWKELKPTLLLQRLPVLVEIFPAKPGQLGGQREHIIGQSSAIVRHLGRVFGLAGKNEEEQTNVDMVIEQIGDWTHLSEPLSQHQPINPDAKKNYLMGAQAEQVTLFERLLELNGSGFLVGNLVTVADIVLWDAICDEIDWLGSDDWLTPLHRLHKFYQEIASRPRIAAYLNSPRRRPSDYVSTG